jgi:N-dimethylarginine dimethylaminohydrolase
MTKGQDDPQSDNLEVLRPEGARPHLAMSETGQLEEAGICSPLRFTVDAPINLTQAHYFQAAPPKPELLSDEHAKFCALLKEKGVDLVELRGAKTSPFELFTRDIGFAIGEFLFVANMAKQIRRPETESLIKAGRARGWKLSRLRRGCIEGGDILLERDVVYVGIGARTSWDAYAELASMLPVARKAVAVPLAEGVLHLDCVLNVLPKGVVLCHRQGLNNGLPDEMAGYDVIDINNAEAFAMAANVLTVDETTVISQTRHDRLNGMLSDRGINVTCCALDETSKLGGGPRCLVMPLHRHQGGGSANEQERGTKYDA